MNTTSVNLLNIKMNEFDKLFEKVLTEGKFRKSSKVIHKGGQSHNKEFNEQMELSRNWHYMWSFFYYNKKHFTYLYALLISFHKLIFYSLRLIFYSLSFNKNKKKYKQRLSGLLNSYMGKSSWYRPKV
jgi:hypothetical protein